MRYLILTAATLFMSCNGIGATFYNRKNASYKEGARIYNLLALGAVFLCWLIKFLTNPTLDAAVIIYSLIFTVGYTTAMLSSVCAYREGPMMLSSLIMQLSMISTTVWGFFFWGSDVTPRVIIGLILVVIALVLCLYTGKSKEESGRISLKWLFYILLFFVGNSVGTITQRTQQLDFDSAYGDFFMMSATAVSFLVCLFLYLKGDKSNAKKIFSSSWYIPLLCGIFNFLQNLFVIILATLLSANIVYPVLMIGSLAITSIFSILIFKEKMNRWQWVGVVIGVVAIALLC